MRIGKSRYIKSDEIHCCTGKFNMVFSLCKVLEVTLYFSKGFSEVVAKVLQPLEVTIVYFLGQKSNLQSSAPQQRYKLFLSHFLYLLLVNLPLLASLEERSTCRELDYFLRVEDRDSLVDKTTRDRFALFQKATALQVKEAFPYFQE